MYFEGDREEFVILPDTGPAIMLTMAAIPTLLLGIYWVPIADWIDKSLVMFIQTI